MSDEQPKELPDTDDAQEHATASPGRMLKAGRKKQGLSQQQVADKLFLKVTQIDDLENDRIDEKTSVTFTRGYIRNYAKQLGLSQEEVIAEFDRLHTSAKQPARLQSFSRRVAKQTHDDRWMMVTYGIVILLLAGVVAWWYQQSGSETLVDESPVSAVSDNEQAGAAMTTQADNGVISEGDTPQTSTVNRSPANSEAVMRSEQTQHSPTAAESVEAPANEQTQPLTEEQPAQPLEAETAGERDVAEMNQEATTAAESVADTSLASTPSESSAATAAEPGAPINMVFRFADDCWVNIEDGTGEAIAYGIKQAGRVMEISGVPPVEVTLGAPDNVAITVDGEAVDMSVFPGGRTARFSLPIQE